MKRFRLVTDFNALAITPAVWLYIDGDFAIAAHWLCFAIEFVLIEGDVNV